MESDLDFPNDSSADKEDVVKVIQEGGEGLSEERLKSTFEKLRPEIRCIDMSVSQLLAKIYHNLTPIRVRFFGLKNLGDFQEILKTGFPKIVQN